MLAILQKIKWRDFFSPSKSSRPPSWLRRACGLTFFHLKAITSKRLRSVVVRGLSPHHRWSVLCEWTLCWQSLEKCWVTCLVKNKIGAVLGFLACKHYILLSLMNPSPTLLTGVRARQNHKIFEEIFINNLNVKCSCWNLPNIMCISDHTCELKLDYRGAIR